MLDVFFNFFATLLSWFYELWPSYGVSVVLLTVAVMLLVTPLTLKGTRSMSSSRCISPSCGRSRRSTGTTRQKMNEELMKFYSEHKINPVGGCLPLLIQLPVFIILYNVIRGLTQRTSLVESVLSGRGADLAGAFDPKHIDHSSELYQQLHGSSTRCPRSASTWPGPRSRPCPTGSARPGPTSLLGHRHRHHQLRPAEADPGPQHRPDQPQMQMITKVMPVIFVFFSLNFPAALAIYWCTSGLWRIGQQYIIGKHIYTEDAKQAAGRRQGPGCHRSPRPLVTGRAGPTPAPGGSSVGSWPTPSRKQESRGPPAAVGNSAKGSANGNGSESSVVRVRRSPSTPSSRAGSGSGRVTTPGSRPAAARKKKKRK